MILHSYQNGNCAVEIHDDGTKRREWEGDAVPKFPESIDLKITDWCDAGCPYCHEQSTKRGKHGEYDDIVRILEGLPAGVEIAIGGGDPLSHPDIVLILDHMQRRGLVANTTVNAKHIMRSMDRLAMFRSKRLVWGVGFSHEAGMELIGPIMGRDDVVDSNTVIHVIAGVDDVQRVRRLPSDWKILVLGYKRFGFGVKYGNRPEVSKSLNAWRYWIPSLLRGRHVSFDNLAIEQLCIQQQLSPETFARCFMGHDGHFTMYADAVKMEYAVGSTAERFPIGNRTIRDCFASVRLLAACDERR